MCELCHHSPCLSGCPNEPGPRAVYTCANCGDDIYEGDDVFDISGEHWCEACIDDCRHTAEFEEPDYYDDDYLGG
jgi:hypothetical protein